METKDVDCQQAQGTYVTGQTAEGYRIREVACGFPVPVWLMDKHTPLLEGGPRVRMVQKQTCQRFLARKPLEESDKTVTKEAPVTAWVVTLSEAVYRVYRTQEAAEEAKKRFLQSYPECEHRMAISSWPVTF